VDGIKHISVEYHSRRTIRGQLNPKSTAVEEVSHSLLELPLTSLTDQSEIGSGFAVTGPLWSKIAKAAREKSKVSFLCPKAPSRNLASRVADDPCCGGRGRDQ
jgi:hypothetical protein